MSMQRVAVVDYGMGNLHSVAKALEHVADRIEVQVTGDAKLIAAADRVVFPGVGAIRDCIAELERLGLAAVLTEVVASRPLLGICVGMQALMDFSEENDGVDCLGVLPGTVERFAGGVDTRGHRLKVPHMGWNQVEQVSHPMWQGIDDGERFYFVHSYYVRPAIEELVAGRCEYGCYFAAAAAQDQLFAVQFHPEKSDRAGLQLLKNFLAWDGRC